MPKFLTAGCESRVCKAYVLSMWVAAAIYLAVNVAAVAYYLAAH